MANLTYGTSLSFESSSAVFHKFFPRKIYPSINNTPLTTNSNASCPILKDQDLTPLALWEFFLSISSFV